MEYKILLTRILQLLIITVQITPFSETVHLRSAATKAHIKNEIAKNHDNLLGELDEARHDFHHERRDLNDKHFGEHLKIVGNSRRWSHRRRLGASTFSPWTGWTACDYFCKQQRERYCLVRKKCDDIRHVEERRCPSHVCTPLPHNLISSQTVLKHGGGPILRHSGGRHYDDPYDSDDELDYFIIKKKPKKKRQRKQKVIFELNSDEHRTSNVDINDYDNDDEDHNEYNDDDDYNDNNGANFADYRKRFRNSRLSRLNRKHNRRKTHDLVKKSYAWDRQYNNDDENDEDDIDTGDGDLDNIDDDLNTDDETTMTTPTDDTDRRTSLKRKNVRGSDIPAARYNNFNGESQKLDRNYASIFEDNFHNLKPTIANGLVNNRDWPLQQQPMHLNHNQEINRRWDSPYFAPYPTRPPAFSNPVHFAEDFYRGRSNANLANGWPNMNFSMATPVTATTQTPFLNFAGKTEIKNYGKEKAVFDMPSRFRRIYSKWSKWSKCTAKCTTRRFKRCKAKDICGNEVIREVAYCYTEGSFCQTWIDGQVKRNAVVDSRSPAQHLQNALRPYHKDPLNAATSRRETNAISDDYQVATTTVATHHTKQTEQLPQNVKCGVPTIRNKPKHYLWGMLRIIGGKTARRGQWPWQVAILNRFKEAFCGGTLISPLWVLTAAHCVRRKLFVRLGEHNLEVEDGSEIQFRVEFTIKHPKYDKRTVDNDVAMLRLPKEVSQSPYIGFACLPQSYQQLPKHHQCTIIGWGKRRNSDDAGTNVLHEAEVPIISNEDCRNVYYDYTITKNMFCAGHRRGRIDTCAGDSGGPLLCRDTTLPNQPWTIFGITSFGDGCGKRNKFGIYAKLPNYVDWIWSVINCNGKCNT